MSELIFGLDIGGTGIKGGIVDVQSGQLTTERFKVATPHPATPKEVARASRKVLDHFNWNGPVGVGFPAIIKNNVCYSATNISKKWIGVNVAEILKHESPNSSFEILNDADAAAICEDGFGAGKDLKGCVLMTTIGTGIGTGLLFNHTLIPNCELGTSCLPNGMMLEKYCSNVTRKRLELSFEEWGDRLGEGLMYMYKLLGVDTFILGGGVSKRFDRFSTFLPNKLNIVPAQHRNEAGCLGAALWYSSVNKKNNAT